jgi:hypothetical protein
MAGSIGVLPKDIVSESEIRKLSLRARHYAVWWAASPHLVRSGYSAWVRGRSVHAVNTGSTGPVRSSAGREGPAIHDGRLVNSPLDGGRTAASAVTTKWFWRLNDIRMKPATVRARCIPDEV